MFKNILVAAVSSVFTLSAFAVHANWVEKSIPLKDGTTVHVFPDGKMAMENKYGRASLCDPGHVMETRDGKRITMNGNELTRLDIVLNKGNDSP